ncbi:MAG TPA: DUF167 family protein [Tepidiformaceae bacterium]|nr:DUF167 family protein [Tepidiformaceae bacterium]
MHTRITVRVTPRASRDEVTGRDSDGVIHVRVTAAPADGAANAAVHRLLARILDIPGRDLELVAGQTSRLKQFEVDLPPEAVAARIPMRP